MHFNNIKPNLQNLGAFLLRKNRAFRSNLLSKRNIGCLDSKFRFNRLRGLKNRHPWRFLSLAKYGGVPPHFAPTALRTVHPPSGIHAAHPWRFLSLLKSRGVPQLFNTTALTRRAPSQRPPCRARPAVYVFLLIFAAACAREADAKPQPKLETAVLTVEKAAGGTTTITAELARTDAEKQKGLMFRKTLADGDGMLFIYTRDERMAFWMKNTLVPLSIAFISRDGRIIDILDMEPLSTQSVRSTRSVRYALEVPRGWFAREGIAEGDSIHGLNF